MHQTMVVSLMMLSCLIREWLVDFFSFLAGTPSSCKAVFSADGVSESSPSMAANAALARLKANPAVQRAFNPSINF